MKCNEVEQVIRRWENKGEFDREIEATLVDHVETCSACDEKYNTLIPFILRDSERNRNKRIKLTNSNGTILTEQNQPLPLFKTKWQKLGLAFVCLVFLATIAISTVMVLMNPSSRSGQTVKHEFKIAAENAENVYLVGDFTNWEDNKVKMTDQDNNGIWEAQVELAKNKIYKYNYIVDDKKWITDPKVPSVDDGFGGKTSVLQY